MWDKPSDGYSSYSDSDAGSSSNYNAYYRSSEGYKTAKFNDSLHELLENLDLDPEVSYSLEEMLYILANQRGVSERQIFKLALLRALNDLVKEAE